MNDDRRKKLSAIKEKLEELMNEVVEIEGAEQEAFENMPQSFQDGEKGEKAQTVLSNLEGISGELQSIIDNFDSIEE